MTRPRRRFTASSIRRREMSVPLIPAFTGMSGVEKPSVGYVIDTAFVPTRTVVVCGRAAPFLNGRERQPVEDQHDHALRNDEPQCGEGHPRARGARPAL